MKLHGKGKIFSRQTTHIYLRISWNLEDEIFPKGVGVVTPKILFGFFKTFIWFEGGDLKFFLLLRNSPSQNIFFYDKCFVLDSPKTWFWSWRFFLLVWTQNQMLFTWEISFENLLNSPMAFGVIFSPFQNPLLPWPKCKSPPISLSSSLDHDLLQNQQVGPLHIFISIYFLSKTISAFYPDPWRFTKELLFLLWVLPPNQLP